MDIIEIENQNPWWTDKEWFKKDRKLITVKSSPVSYEWKPFKLKKGVFVVYGPRQVGKTTWIKQEIERLTLKGISDILYLACDGFLSTKELKDSLKNLLEYKTFRYIFLDEITYVDNWEQIIKYFVDMGWFKEKVVILTGSSSLNVLKKSERLPGRLSGQKRFYPLTFREFVDTKITSGTSPTNEQLFHLFRRYLIHGGVLKVINEYERNSFVSSDILNEYAGSIDGELSKVRRSPRIFNYILSKVIKGLTNPLSWSSIAGSEVSQPTVAEYIEIGKEMMFLDYIENLSSYDRAFVKNKKVYFLDPFLFWVALYRIKKIDYITSDLLSAYENQLVENAVFSNLLIYLDRKLNRSVFRVRNHLFYIKNRKEEIDFYLEKKRLEVKWSNTFSKKRSALYLTKNSLGDNEIPVYRFLYDISSFMEKSQTLI